MRAGLLEEKIKIYETAVMVNEYGEETTEWNEKYSTRARLIHDGGGRTNENQEIFYASIKTFQVRYYVPVGYFDRIEWNGNFYRIIDIVPDKVQQNLTIKTELINE